MMSLEELFEGLGKGEGIEKAAFRAVQIPRFDDWYVGADTENYPTILISASEPSSTPAIKLALVEVSFGVPCAVEVAGEIETKRFSFVICRSPDPALRGLFFRVWAALMDDLGPTPDQQSLFVAVQRLVSLFQRLAQPAVKDFYGIVGELVVLHASADPEFAIGAWRNEDFDRFDFGSEGIRLEVKAASSRERRHHVSLAQCSAPPGTRGYLASVFVEHLGGGALLSELIEMIQKRVHHRPDLLVKLDDVIATTLGASYSQVAKQRLDLELAVSSLQFYDIDTVPAIRTPIPTGVTDVRFRTDLSFTDPIDLSRLGPLGGLAPAKPVREGA